MGLFKAAEIIDREFATLTFERDIFQAEMHKLQQRVDAVHGALADAGNIVVDYDRLGEGVRVLIGERDAAQEHEDEAWLKVNELRAEVAAIRGRLDDNEFDRDSVIRAREVGVCRICGKPQSNPFTFNHGMEFAHTECLDVRSAPPPIPIDTTLNEETR